MRYTLFPLQVLRSIGADGSAKIIGNARSLLQNVLRTTRAPYTNKNREVPAPFVIAVSSPLQRPAIRTLLGCAMRHLGGTEKKDDIGVDSGEQRSCEQAPEGPWDPFWCQLCIASNWFYVRAPLDRSLDCSSSHSAADVYSKTHAC